MSSNIIIDNSPTIYSDESIFTNGRNLQIYDVINVYNRADEYLIRRLNKTPSFNCIGKTHQTNNLEKFIANINPKIPCLGVNIYTLSLLNSNLQDIEPFNQVIIYEGETKTPIYIGEHVDGNIYDIGDLTPLESAIMIKYFAINYQIFITRHLYKIIEPYFEDIRVWFETKNYGIVQNNKKELILNDQIINAPDLTISSPAIFI